MHRIGWLRTQDEEKIPVEKRSLTAQDPPIHLFLTPSENNHQFLGLFRFSGIFTAPFPLSILRMATTGLSLKDPCQGQHVAVIFLEARRLRGRVRLYSN